MEYWKKNHRHAWNYWILSLNIRNICKGQAKWLKLTHKRANKIYYNRYKDHFSGSYFGQQVHLSYRYVFELIPCSIWEKYSKDKNFCEFWVDFYLPFTVWQWLYIIYNCKIFSTVYHIKLKKRRNYNGNNSGIHWRNLVYQ